MKFGQHQLRLGQLRRRGPSDSDRLPVARWSCQRIAYCLARSGAIVQTGKQGNTRLYALPAHRLTA